MSDQAHLPGQSPEQLRFLEVQAKLFAIAREISALDIGEYARAVPCAGPEENLACAAMAFKRRLRETGVFSHLAILAHQQREASRRA